MAVLYTFIIYILLFLLVGATCERSASILMKPLSVRKGSQIVCLLSPRTLLTQDYGFLQKINVWPPFVTIGIYCSSLSAAMCAMIGASRILHALAVDHLFGEALTGFRSRGRSSLFFSFV